MTLDVVVFGGGIAGLWTLHGLADLGYAAALFEAEALGSGQSVQAQGIIHGGGKYALRRVHDIASVRAIRDMPERWRRHLRGELRPDLTAARLLSPSCDLWIPRGGWSRRLAALGFFPLVRRAGMLASAPQTVAPAKWPQALRGSALRVERLAEPVLDTRSVLAALAAPLRSRLFAYERSTLEVLDQNDHFTLRLRTRDGSQSQTIRSRAVLLCAGNGNRELLECFAAPAPMQQRPLRMLLLRGELPELFAHCVDGGRTRLTITSMRDLAGRMVWQVGGEIAERHAERSEAELFDAARRELRSTLPGLELSGLVAASYVAVRAEAADPRGRRPSGVQVQELRPRLLAAWPTKFALAPLLAAELCARLLSQLGKPTGPPAAWPAWPSPELARPPWEDERTWQPL